MLNNIIISTMNKSNKKKEAIEQILDKFEDYLKSEDRKPLKVLNDSSAYTYRNQLKSVFCVREAFLTNENICSDYAPNANAAMNFLDLMPKLINNGNEAECNYGIVKLISDTKKIKDKYNWKENRKKNLGTYLSAFLEFIEKAINNKDNNKDYFQIKKVCKGLKLTAADRALLKGIKEGELYTYNILKTKFKSRLRSQDRVSGDKIWLPLRFIAKIYSTYVKKQKIKKNAYLEWLNSLVDSIYIHYYDDDRKINHVSFGSDVSLLLKKVDKNKELYNVFVRFKDNEKSYTVLTPTGKGNEKEEMQVTGINSIAIDHVIPIDKTLRDLENELNELKKISDAYKELQEKDNPEEAMDASIQSLLNKIKWENLEDNLDKIRDHGPLRLMASKHNTQKSNGETFIEIRKDDRDNYYGILSKNVHYKCIENMTLYQNLKENGISRVCINEVPGENIDKIENFDIRDIIDLI